MIYVCAAVFALLSAGRKNSKVIFYMGLVFLFLTAVFSYDNADSYLYELQYYASENAEFTLKREPGWQLLNRLFCSAGFNFYLFKAFIYGAGLFLISRTVMRLSGRKNHVLLFYMIFPFIIDVTQIRNFFAMSLLLYAIPSLIDDREGGILRYTAFVLLAVSVHYVFVIYLGLIPARYFSVGKFIAVDIIGVFSAPFVIKILPELVLFFFRDFHGRQAYKYVLNGTISARGTVICAIYFLMNAALCAVSFYMSGRGGEERERSRNTIALKMNLLVSLTYFLTLYSLDFIRVIRNILIVNYCLWLNVKWKNRIDAFAANLVLLAFALVSLYLFIYYDFSDTVFYPVFENNYFFDWFQFE